MGLNYEDIFKKSIPSKMSDILNERASKWIKIKEWFNK